MSVLSSWYSRWMEDWERSLCFAATNRVVRPFDWGLEWTRSWPVARDYPQNGHDSQTYLLRLNQSAIATSEGFYGYQTPADFHLKDGRLRFTSPVRTPYPENNVVHGQWFPAKDPKKAVIVLPHWNAPAQAHNGLAIGIQKLGMSALRLSLPYHDYRMPAELERADYAVSSNIGRTIDATRQAVIDIRSTIDWLQRQGYERLGIVGTSLGSCYAFLASSHDPRIAVNVFNHCSTYFSDVVWTGLSTMHVKEGLESHVDLDTLRNLWMCISPTVYFQKFAGLKKRSLFLYARYDTTFIPRLSEETMRMADQFGLDYRKVVLPCGHYTLGKTPFKFVDGYHICSFLKRNL
ncbi:MAG: alpha/beta hydrolase family protein [Bryobacterales bacterium]|nr:alpha/beta hydrolase family protein [Bryobacterales bacterium]